jgi:N-acetylglucosaminyldiphosphoundecaprenol N-acetyl-beta-D-mannosaminyltransferase
MTMYLRYGDLSWDSVESRDGKSDARAEALSRTARLRRSGRRRIARPSSLPSIMLHGVKIHAITEAACIQHILDQLDAGYGGTVITPNLDHIRRAMRDITFGALLTEADLVVADGMPLVWAAKLQGTPVPQRIAGSDLISTLSAAIATRNKSMYLLGGAPGTAEGAAEVLRKRHPGINVIGTLCPPMGFETDEKILGEITETLRNTRPDIVFVALGSPKQENLVNSMRAMLPETWWLGVGNSFSFLSGDVRRAPRWMQSSGLEWVHRLLQEPKRLFKRYVLVGLPFAASMMTRSAALGLVRKVIRRKEEPAPVTIRIAESPNGNGNGHGETTAVVEAINQLTPTETDPATEPREDESNSLSSVSIVTNRPSVSSHLRTRLRGLILLGGSVRPTALTTSIERSVLDLPLDDGGSIFNHWLGHAMDLSRLFGIDSVPVRLMVDLNSPEPVSAANRFAGTYTVERDHGEYRGTGGVLRDMAAEYDDEDLLLVANAAQVLLDPLSGVTTLLDRKAGDVTVVSHRDGSPSGIMLVKCKTLRLIPRTGFVDMKEQALPQIASKFDVRVAHRRRPTGLPIRTLADYVLALRLYHRRRLGKPAVLDALSEDWQPTFAIVEPGAVVDPRARVHDAVVLRGGTVEQNGVLVRSVVCAGGIVRKDRTAVDQFVCPTPAT